MPNKHFCQGPTCHQQVTTDRFLKSRGVIRGRYARLDRDYDHRNNDCDELMKFLNSYDANMKYQKIQKLLKKNINIQIKW